MGITSSSQLPPPGQGHDPLFYKGVKALSEGRYTISETFFHQAIQRHPGRDFWDGVLAAAEPPKQKRKPGGFEQEETRSELPSTSRHAIKEILLPLDNKFVELHDFARLVADIAVNYYYQAVALGSHAEADMVRRVGMMYSGYLAMRMQVGMLMLHVMLNECTEAATAAEKMQKKHLAEQDMASVPTRFGRSLQSTHLTSVPKESFGPSDESKPQFSATNPPPPELLIKILSLKEKCVTMWINSVLSYANSALQCSTLYPTTAEGEKERKKIMSMAWDCVDMILSVLRNVASVYKNLTTATLFEAHLKQMRMTMNIVGMGSEGYGDDIDRPNPESKSGSKSLEHSVALMSFGSGAAEYQGDNMQFVRLARSMDLGVAPLLHTMSITHVRFKADMSCGVVTRIPSSLHPVNHSVYHYIDWLMRDLSAAPLYAGKSDFFLRVNKIVMPLDISDRLAFRMLMGEEVLLMSYAVMFLEATLLRQMNRTEETPKLMQKATDLVLTTYGGDSTMCYEINELFKKFLGASM